MIYKFSLDQEMYQLEISSSERREMEFKAFQIYLLLIVSELLTLLLVCHQKWVYILDLQGNCGMSLIMVIPDP